MRMQEFKYEATKLTEKIQRKIAWALPKSIVSWAYIRVVAHATTGRYETQIVPYLTALEALDRWNTIQPKPIHPNLVDAHNHIKWSKKLEQKQGYDRVIEWSRLPKVIKHNKQEFYLHYGDIDDSVYLSYTDDGLQSGAKGKVLMHYEEPALRDCITKAWRHIAEKGVKVS